MVIMTARIGAIRSTKFNLNVPLLLFMLSVVILCKVMLRVFMLSVVMPSLYAECCYTECFYAKYRVSTKELTFCFYVQTIFLFLNGGFCLSAKKLAPQLLVKNHLTDTMFGHYKIWPIQG